MIVVRRVGGLHGQMHVVRLCLFNHTIMYDNNIT